MLDSEFVRLVEQPVKIQFSFSEISQITAALSQRVEATSFRIFVFGGIFVAFNSITFGLFKKPLGPVALFLMKDVAARESALRTLAKIKRTLIVGLDGRTTTVIQGMKEVVEKECRK